MEAVEKPSHRFFHGVQWHPERINQFQMYSALVRAARGS
ncbi:MAG: gamma-glutamyl-gamma-aminobutyrate hydrolase family protein [Candidatus Thermoplasmatota archaeon]|nr:gamma-glutamyl-gamma-aminobutyrate hydrolase family protein [Candidatus Thermoplasmatota archaeon]